MTPRLAIQTDDSQRLFHRIPQVGTLILTILNETVMYVGCNLHTNLTANVVKKILTSRAWKEALVHYLSQKLTVFVSYFLNFISRQMQTSRFSSFPHLFCTFLFSTNHHSGLYLDLFFLNHTFRDSHTPNSTICVWVTQSTVQTY